MFNYELTTGHLYSEGCEANLTEFLEAANSFTNHPLVISSTTQNQQDCRFSMSNDRISVYIHALLRLANLAHCI